MNKFNRAVCEWMDSLPPTKDMVEWELKSRIIDRMRIGGTYRALAYVRKQIRELQAELVAKRLAR